tara:strand:- start:17851 stop:18792 length:942 start_codon:yes stop_codon:yes gene_type:complete
MNKKVIYIVDNIDYIRSTPYQNQLFISLQKICELKIVDLNFMKRAKSVKNLGSYDEILVCLKLRTIKRNISLISSFLEGEPFRVYEQDPWENYMDNGDWKGTYQLLMNNSNVLFFANTSKTWADFGLEKGIPTKFVRMGIIPEFCNNDFNINEKQYDIGFIGRAHPYRKSMIDYINLNTKYNFYYPLKERPFSHSGFLKEINKIKIYCHNESLEVLCDNKKMNLADGMWVKNIEAMAAGCFSLRNYSKDLHSYIDDSFQTFFTFNNFEEIEEIVDKILSINKKDSEKMIKETIENIIKKDYWKETAQILIGER